MVEDSFGSSSAIPKIFTITEYLEEQCPLYMAMGMSYDDYWNGDMEMPKYYRKAFKLKKQQMNERLWFQGLYIYEALKRIYPLFNAWAETQPEPYLENPIPLDAQEEALREQERQKKEMDQMREYLERQMATAKVQEGGQNGRSTTRD